MNPSPSVSPWCSSQSSAPRSAGSRARTSRVGHPCVAAHRRAGTPTARSRRRCRSTPAAARRPRRASRAARRAARAGSCRAARRTRGRRDRPATARGRAEWMPRSRVDGKGEPCRPQRVAAEQRQEPGCAGGEELIVGPVGQSEPQGVEVAERRVEPALQARVAADQRNLPPRWSVRAAHDQRGSCKPIDARQLDGLARVRDGAATSSCHPTRRPSRSRPRVRRSMNDTVARFHSSRRRWRRRGSRFHSRGRGEPRLDLLQGRELGDESQPQRPC